MEIEPRILGYAAPPPASGFVCAPEWIIALVALLVPGLSSALIRGGVGVLKMALLWLTMFSAFVFFGPVWGEILFRNTWWQEAGLYPFLGTCLIAEVLSVVSALRDRERVLGQVV